MTTLQVKEKDGPEDAAPGPAFQTTLLNAPSTTGWGASWR